MAGTIRRGKALRADLALWDGKTATASRIDASGGTITGLTIGNEVDVLQVFGSGTERARASIVSALNHISTSNATLAFAPGTWTIDSNLTVGSNFSCRIPAGCVFSVSAGVTLTFSGDVYTEDPESWFTGSGSVVVSREGLHGGVWHRTAAERAAVITPTNYQYLAGRPVYDVTRYGASPSASASANSTAIQAAVDVADEAGGGTVYIPTGTYNTDAPIIVPAGVHILGDDQYGTILVKTTATASSVTDATVRFYDSATVGFPICVIHFVEGSATGWSGTCRKIQVRGNTASPNTTAVNYGFFFCGMSNGLVEDCVSQYVVHGFFWGVASTIYSTIRSNVAINVQRGFYQHFATSTAMYNNYAVNYRFQGYYWSAYYSGLHGNASDSGGTTWKVGTTEICLAYDIHGCIEGSVKDNGCESHNGSVWKLTGNIGTEFSHNLAGAIVSNYTGGGDVVLLELDGNVRIQAHDNTAQTDSVTGTAGRHFIYKIGSENGIYTWSRNLFVDAYNDQTSTSVWANISGTIQEEYEAGTFTGTLTGVTTVVTGTLRWERHRNQVTLYWPDLSGTSNATTMTITGMPAGIRPARQIRVSVRVRDNGTVGIGSALIETTGVVTLLNGATETTFTGSGTKSIFHHSVSYIIT